MSLSSPTTLSIWNRALQLLGQPPVSADDEVSKAAEECTTCYEPTLRKCLEQHVWKFALKLASLAADSTAPDFGRGYSYTLPADYVVLAPDYEEDNFLGEDYEVEDGKIITDYGAPLQIRYVSLVTNPVKMPALFRELVSTEMAFAMCEAMTQSNNKKLALERDLPKVWAAARRHNARQGKSQTPLEGSWIDVRQGTTPRGVV